MANVVTLFNFFPINLKASICLLTSLIPSCPGIPQIHVVHTSSHSCCFFLSAQDVTIWGHVLSICHILQECLSWVSSIARSHRVNSGHQVYHFLVYIQAQVFFLKVQCCVRIAESTEVHNQPHTVPGLPAVSPIMVASRVTPILGPPNCCTVYSITFWALHKKNANSSFPECIHPNLITKG